jgi:hypothetical protein
MTMATSRNSSYADKVTDAEKLLTAVRLNAALLGDVERERVAVETALNVAREVSGLQKNAAGERQQATQNLTDALFALSEAIRLLRGIIRIRVGPRLEKLVEFGIGPLRPRRSRGSTTTPPSEPPSEPGGPPPGPTPA